MRRSAAPILSDGPGSRFTIRALTPIGTATGIVGLGGGGTIWGDGYAMTFTVPILGSSMSRRGFELAFGHGAIYSFTGRCSLSDIFVLDIARVMGADREKDAEISALMKGYVFDSTDASDPLTFVVVRDHGFVYVSGKGTVTLPNGKQMRF